MSGNVGEHQRQHTLSTLAPRKRPRQDVDPGARDSEGNGGNGSSSSERVVNDDRRQGGSQKRARSEGHGDSEVSRSTLSWNRHGEVRGTPNQMHAPLAVSPSTRLPGSTTIPRYLNSNEALRDSLPEGPLTPLPPASPTLDGQRDDPNYDDNRPVGQTFQEDIERSTVFDAQVDVLRRPPVSLPSSPTPREHIHSVELPLEVHSTQESEPSVSSESNSSENIGELEIPEPEVRTPSQADQPIPSSLQTLANTASLHSRILHSPTGRMTPTLPPILPSLPGQNAQTTTSDPSLSMLPRLRMLRRHDQHRGLPRPVSLPSLNYEVERNRNEAPVGLRNALRSTDEALRSSAGGRTAPLSPLSAMFPSQPPTNVAREATGPSAFPAPNRNRRSFDRHDLFHEARSPFDFFEWEGRFFPEVEESPLLAFRLRAARRARGQPSPLPIGDPIDRPFEPNAEPPRDRPGYLSNISGDDRVVEASRTAAEVGPHEDSTRARLWRHVGSDQLPGSSWNGIFDRTDSERNSPSHRATSQFDDIRRRMSDSEQVVSPRSQRSIYDMFRDDLRRRSSPWNSPRHLSGQFGSDRTPHASLSSISSSGRSASRSLLDPTLRFGSGSSTLSSRSSLSLTSVQEQERANRLRHRSRPSLCPWFNERNVEEGSHPLDPSRSESERRRGSGIAPISSPPSSIESIRNEDPPSPSGSSPRHTDSSRGTQPDAGRLTPIQVGPADREQALRTPLRAPYDLESLMTTSQIRSPISWDNDSAVEDPSDGHLTRSARRRFSPALTTRHLPALSALRESGPPLPATPAHVIDFGERPLSNSSRLRLRRVVAQDRALPLDGPRLGANSMEDVIPESDARESSSINARFGRHPPLSLFAPSNPAFPPIDPPPRPVEPRLSSWDNVLRPTARARIRSPSPPPIPLPLRQGRESSDTVGFSSTPSHHPQPPMGISYRSVFDRQPDIGTHEQPSAQRRLTTSGSSDERRLSHTVSSSAHPDSHSEPGLFTRSPLSPTRHGNSHPRVETFNELVRRRAARAEAQARAGRRPHSPEAAVFRPTYRLPRPSFLADEEDPLGRRDRALRQERRSFAALSGNSTVENSSTTEDPRRGRFERQRAALLLERTLTSRYSNGNDWNTYNGNFLIPSPTFGLPRSNHNLEERNGGARSSDHTRFLERPGRQSLFSSPLDALEVENAEGSEGARERQELHNAIGRHSRDDEHSIRRSLLNTDRIQRPAPRDPMSAETTRNLQRRLRESEAEVGRALRALDQWGELEGSEEHDTDSTQSRMRRFGETLRRRRVPPAFGFSDTSIDQESTFGASSTARPTRRSPSPTTTTSRLHSRQARFARAQGRLRELGVDMFGESRGRGVYTSRLDMLGGSFASRYIARNLGDYVRDEDFDASYENLVRLAAAIGEAKPRGTPAHLLAAMPTGFYKDFATPGCDVRCPICLDDYKDLDPVLRISDCDHWFHKECLEQWLSGENSCPICRRRIRGRCQKEPHDDVPGPSGSRRDDGSDDETPGGGTGGPDRVGSPGLTLEELSSYASGW